MIWLVFIGLFLIVVGIYWMSTSSHDRGYQSPESREKYHTSFEKQRVEDEIRTREMEERHRLRGWRRR